MTAIANTSKFVYQNATPTSWQESFAIKKRMIELDQEVEHYNILRQKYVIQLKTLIPPQENAVHWYLNSVRHPSAFEREAYDRWCNQIAEHDEAKKIAIRLVGVSMLRIKILNEWNELNRVLPIRLTSYKFFGLFI